MSQARLAAAPRSYARQRAGHQTGTPDFSRTSPRRASNTPWLARAPTTIHALDLNPTTAASAKAVITIDVCVHLHRIEDVTGWFVDGVAPDIKLSSVSAARRSASRLAGPNDAHRITRMPGERNAQYQRNFVRD